MIVFDLHCVHGHRFEGWFGSSSEYEDQSARGLVSCPECGSEEIGKAPMAPAVGAKSNRSIAVTQPQATEEVETQPLSNKPVPAEVQHALKALHEAQTKALKDSTWVGKDFASQSREMHYGERDHAAIHGQASLEEAKALADEGVPVAALPFPVAPPDELN
ncbi:MAG: DUF1178 family protein [Erythrobacter sp.]